MEILVCGEYLILQEAKERQKAPILAVAITLPDRMSQSQVLYRFIDGVVNHC
jgi:hypothetical protein